MEKAIEQIDKWKQLRTNLNNNYVFNDDWQKAISIFEERFLNHYLNPLDDLVSRKNHKGEGFAIATVICSYMEALAAFKHGKIYNSKHNKNSPAFEYRNSSGLYIDFLNTESVFKDNFWQDDGNGNRQIDKPFSAKDFYENVRCALVHESMTKNNWVINARKSDKLNSPVFIENNKGKKSLMRSVLHARMIDYLISYVELLRQNSQVGANARRLFARKMDHLFEIKRDHTNFEWWQIGVGD